MAKLAIKTKIIIGCAVAAVAGIAVAAVVLFGGKTETYRVLKVFELIGTAIVDRSDVGELDSYVGMNLEGGDALTVGTKSNLRLSLDSDKYVLLDQNTVMELVAEGTESDSRTSLNLVSGTILNEITEPLSANSTYEVSTPKATMAVRGTSFSVTVKKIGNSYITTLNTYHGSVAIQLIDENGTPKGEVVLVSEGKSVSIATDPNSESGNDPIVDGNSYFVFLNGDESIAVAEGENPVTEIDYSNESEIVFDTIIESNNSGRLTLDADIANIIISYTQDSAIPPQAEQDINPAVEDESVADEPAENEPVENEPAENEPVENEPVADEPVEDKPVADEPAENGPVADKPAADEPEEKAEQDNSTDDENMDDIEIVEEAFIEDESEDVPDDTDTNTDDVTPSNSQPWTPYYPTCPIIPDAPFYPTIPDNTEPDAAVYTVTFVCDDEIISTATVNAGETVSEIPAIPEKTGYIGKWIFNGTEFTNETIITNDITVVAVYTSEICTVTFTDENGEIVSTVNVEYGGTVDAIPDVPEKAGYIGKWVCEDVEFTEETVITDNMSVIPEYSAGICTVTFTDENGAIISTVDVEYGGTVGAIPAVPEKTGYTGIWVSGIVDFSESTIITEDMTVFPMYTAAAVTVRIYRPHLTPLDTYDYMNEHTASYGQTFAAAGLSIANLTALYDTIYDDIDGSTYYEGYHISSITVNDVPMTDNMVIDVSNGVDKINGTYIITIRLDYAKS